jgi:hypothetical protein
MDGYMPAILIKKVSVYLKKYKTMDRRNFFKSGGRLLLLGGMAAVTGYLAVNGKLEKSGTCKIASHCRGCSKLKACSEDQATGFRKTNFLPQ